MRSGGGGLSRGKKTEKKEGCIKENNKGRLYWGPILDQKIRKKLDEGVYVMYYKKGGINGLAVLLARASDSSQMDRLRARRFDLVLVFVLQIDPSSMSKDGGGNTSHCWVLRQILVSAATTMLLQIQHAHRPKAPQLVRDRRQA